jgi:hypothetical protein
MRTIVNHIVAGRWDEVRPPSEPEIRATVVLALSTAEASAKIRSGPPLDDHDDYALRVWAGELPFSLEPCAPVADPQLPLDITLPDYIVSYRRGAPH